ncbi:MAG: family 20 glycosylhydrolase, partial [Oscillospiraceae bacterium]|nr:family 20 glycosylhydrolase [Oscillospiraceae bacterium]
ISGGIFPSLVCAGREETRRFLKDVLDEITELFPFPMVHIGGDEALKLHWRRCPDCRRRMRELSLNDENELQRELVLDIGAYLAEKGRDTVVWSDVLEGGMLPPHFIVQQWYGDRERTERFMEQGGRVICSDCEAYYLDYPYGRIDVKTIREFPRIPKYAEGREDRLLGLECPLWTERVTNIEKAAFLLFPRMCAVGIKAQGSGPLSAEEFNGRVADMTDRIRAMGLNAAPKEYWEMSAETAERDRMEDRERIHAPEAENYVEQEQTLVLLEKTERFMRKLSIPEEFLLRAGDRILAGVYGQGVLPDEDGEEELARQLMEAVRSREEGAWRRFPEEIWISTMGCFPRFISEYRASLGRDGFDRGVWTVRQVDCRLFRIGELEYELAEDSGERYISLHIPSDAVLDAGRLNDSLERAKAFLKEYFPERYGERMLCESWLLSPALEDLLPADSRILRFRRAFTITDIFPDDDSALQWVFGTAEKQKDTVVPEDLPEKTSLQRALKARLLSGRKPGSAIGILTGSFS